MSVPNTSGKGGISSPFPEAISEAFSTYTAGLTSAQREALKFGLGGVFLGATAGLTAGGVTSLMRGMEPAVARANLINSCKVFTLAGFTFGLAGASLLALDPEAKDDYKTNMISGCAAGLSLGIYNRSVPVACVGCVSLGALAAFAKFFDEQPLDKESPTLQAFTKPQFRSDQAWTHSSK